MTNTPAQAGFYMPAEWEEHEGTWLQWPRDGTHPGGGREGGCAASGRFLAAPFRKRDLFE